jgi:hypothetical protein
VLGAGVLFGATMGSTPARASEAADRADRFEKAFELSGIDRVRLQNVNGPVRIASWDRTYLRVTAVKKAKGAHPDDDLRDTEIRVTKNGSTIAIETILPKRGMAFGLLSLGRSRGADVSYELLRPPSMPVDIETVNGRITAEKRTGSVSLNTVNGSVRVEAQDGPLKVNTVNGSVEVGFAGLLKSSELETVNGSVAVSCSKDSSIQYNLQTVNGRIQSEFATLNVEGKWGPKEARGSLNGGRQRLAIETVNGEVRLKASDAALATASPRL